MKTRREILGALGAALTAVPYLRDWLEAEIEEQLADLEEERAIARELMEVHARAPSFFAFDPGLRLVAGELLSGGNPALEHVWRVWLVRNGSLVEETRGREGHFQLEDVVGRKFLGPSLRLSNVSRRTDRASARVWIDADDAVFVSTDEDGPFQGFVIDVDGVPLLYNSQGFPAMMNAGSTLRIQWPPEGLFAAHYTA